MNYFIVYFNKISPSFVGGFKFYQAECALQLWAQSRPMWARHEKNPKILLLNDDIDDNNYDDW